MPRPLVKAGSLPAGGAGASSGGIKAPPKVSTLEELSALERVVMLFLGLNNIRKASIFPRDPKRLFP